MKKAFSLPDKPPPVPRHLKQSKFARTALVNAANTNPWTGEKRKGSAGKGGWQKGPRGGVYKLINGKKVYK